MRLLVGAVLGLSLACGAAVAQTRAPGLEQQADETARAIRDALERAMRLLDGALGSIPQYQIPEILPNGDIIIRRVPTVPADPAPRPAPPTPNRPSRDPKQEET